MVKASYPLGRAGPPLPGDMLTFRPVGDDIEQVAQWIAAGRATEAFRPGPGPTAESLAKFQARTRAHSDRYDCVVIEQGRRPVGYLDWTIRGRAGEVLGLYIIPEARRQGIAHFALRYATAAMRRSGCARARVEAYSGNRASLQMCHAAGFAPVSLIHRKVDPAPAILMERSLRPWARMSPEEPAYRRLEGDNLLLYHMALADALASEICKRPGVDAVLGLGSIARGFGDEWSDLDVAVMARGPVVDSLWRGERWVAGVSVDLFVIDLDAVPPERWDLARRQAFEESVVLFARSPGFVQATRRALRLKPGERRKAILDLIFKLGWLGFSPASWFFEQRYGYIWSLPNDVWLRRGCAASAHGTIDRAIDMLLELLFLVNRRHIPDPKWRRYLAPELAWVPQRFRDRLEAMEQAPRSPEACPLRANELVALVGDVCEMLEQQGLLKGDEYRRFLQTFPDYDPRS